MEYVHPDHQQRLADHFVEHLVNPGETISVEFQARDVSGEWRWVEARGQTLLAEDPVDGILEVIRDVTEHKQQQFKAERENERLHEFTSLVSQDVRDPLHEARGEVERTRANCDSEHLETAATAGNRCSSVIERVLALARAGEEVGELESVNLTDTILNCWRNVETRNAMRITET